ncbi:MAG: hypothetical protein ACYS47_03585 [Planctomycetota bacterium]|jgi:hypothetical protein
MMRMILPASLLLVAVVSGVLSAGAGEKVAPEGIGRVLQEAAPPDFSAFPPGTSTIRVQFKALRAGNVHNITWEFERNGAEGPVIPRHGDVDPGDGDDPPRVFPASPPADGPVRSLRSLLEGFHRRDVPKIQKYLPASAHDAFRDDPADGRGLIDKLQRILGMDLPAWGDRFLPSLGALGEGIGELELRYRYPGVSGGKRGTFAVKILWFVKDHDADHWIVGEFEPSFRESDEAIAVPKDPAVPRGLRERLTVYGPPEVGAFPPRTVEVRTKGWGRVEGALYEIRANLESRGPGKPLFLEGYSVKPREILRKGHRVPRVPPLEGPLLSVRKALEALEAWDMETVLRYMPPEAREAFDEMGVERMRKEFEREEAERGYSPLRVTLANLPRWFDTRPGWAGIEVEFVFPGKRLKKKGEGEDAVEEEGAFEMKIEAYVPGPEAKNWLVEDLDADFDSE